MSKDNNTKRFHTGKVTTLIFSVIIAIAVWLVAVYVDDPSITVTAKNVSVRFLNEDVLAQKGLIIKEKEDIPRYNLRISGRRSDLVEYMHRITIDVDVSDISAAGAYKINANVNMPNLYITLEKGVNSPIPIEVSDLSQKTIKLYTKQVGTNKEYIVKSEPKNPEITIMGAKEEIDSIIYAMTDVNIADMTHDCDVLGSIYYCNSNNDKVTDVTSVSSDVSSPTIKNTLYKKRTVPVVAVLSEELAEDYVIDSKKTSISPAQIEIGVPDDVEINFVNVIITNDSQDTVEYRATTDVEGVYIPYNNSIVDVKAVLVKSVSKMVNIEVKAINVPSGMNAQFESAQTINVVCAEDISESDISATVDLKDAAGGNSSVKITLEGNDIFSYEDKYIDVLLQ